MFFFLTFGLLLISVVAEFDVSVDCSSTTCAFDTIICPNSANCSVECNDGTSYICDSSTFSGFFGHSLHVDIDADNGFEYGTVICPNNLYNSIDTYHNKTNYRNAASRFVLNCNGDWSCGAIDLDYSYTDVVNVACGGPSSTSSEEECYGADFYVNNVNLLDFSVGAGYAGIDADYYLYDICFVSFSYDDYSGYRCRNSYWEFVNIEMVYGNQQFWDCICEHASSRTVFINSTVIVISGIVKSLDDIQDCTKYGDGEISVINYNPNNIAVASNEIIDNIKNRTFCDKAQVAPTYAPSHSPSTIPTIVPTIPSYMPTSIPTIMPTITTHSPTTIPTAIPTRLPSSVPSNLPSHFPSAAPSKVPTTTQTITTTSSASNAHNASNATSATSAASADDVETTTVTTETQNNEDLSQNSSWFASSDAFIILVIVLAVVCAVLVCSCWIISYLFFNKKSGDARAEQINDFANWSHKNRDRGRNDRVKKVKSVEITDIPPLRSNSGSAAQSTSNMIDAATAETTTYRHYEHSASVSELFNTQETTDGETLDVHVSGEVNVALAEYGDNNNDGDGPDGDVDDRVNNETQHVHVTAGENGNGIGIISSLDESKYQQWTEKQVLIWLKENLLNNGLKPNDAKKFIKEFANMKIVGGTLHALKNNISDIDQFRKEFSNENQAFGTWMVVKSCIQNIGDNLHVD